MLDEWYNGMILFGYYGVVFWKMWVIVMEGLIEGIFFNCGVFYIRKIKDIYIFYVKIWFLYKVKK